MAAILGRVTHVFRYLREKVSVRLVRVDGTEEARISTNIGSRFEFRNVETGWHILVVEWELLQTVKGVNIPEAVSTDVGMIEIYPPADFPDPSVSVLTVCEALTIPGNFNGELKVIVGVFKSGMDETLRLDCPNELVSGGVGFPSSIGLTNVDPPPENLHGQIEAKRQEILKSAPPNAPLRPERVVGLYGHFVALAGLTAMKCCSSNVQTSLPPARLFGRSETDHRVIR